MIITAAHITPLVALIAGVLILVMPRLLNLTAYRLYSEEISQAWRTPR
jgi:hypothetical protein